MDSETEGEKRSNIPVLTQAKTLLDKYKNHPECIEENQLLPVISNQQVNAYLKEIADLDGITKNMITRVVHHTCSTVVMKANNV